MQKNRIMFGAAVLGALMLMFASGVWIGGVATSEAQCLPIRIVSCGPAPCVVDQCGPPANWTLASTVQTFDDNFLGLCMGQ